jgi:prostaglandin-endoperoxide synthase 2
VLSVVRFEQLSRSQRDTLFALGSDRAHVQPGATMFNVLFLREHNRLARLLREAHRGWSDEQVFQTARNTLTVMLLKIVLEEYVNHITPYHFRLRLDPRGLRNPPWYRPNRMAVEFNLLYRWHSLVPSRVVLGGEELPLERTLADNRPLLRAGLGRLFVEASEQPAGRLGLHNTDPVLLPTELASVVQGRQVELDSYNAYRELCGYPRATAFDQLTGDVEVQRELRELYGDVDRVEFYVGLFAEDPRRGSPLGPLTGRMVGVDALSQALTNPLLARAVYTGRTFGAGLAEIERTRCLADVLRRNVAAGTADGRVGMTRADWRPGRR